MIGSPAARPLRPTGDWKGLAGGVAVSAFWMAVAVVIGLRAIAIMGAGFLVPMAFVTGYLFRADLTACERTSRIRFLRVAGDEPKRSDGEGGSPGANAHHPTPSNAVPQMRPTRGWRPLAVHSVLGAFLLEVLIVMDLKVARSSLAPNSHWLRSSGGTCIGLI